MLSFILSSVSSYAMPGDLIDMATRPKQIFGMGDLHAKKTFVTLSEDGKTCQITSEKTGMNPRGHRVYVDTNSIKVKDLPLSACSSAIVQKQVKAEFKTECSKASKDFITFNENECKQYEAMSGKLCTDYDSPTRARYVETRDADDLYCDIQACVSGYDPVTGWPSNVYEGSWRESEQKNYRCKLNAFPEDARQRILSVEDKVLRELSTIN